MADRKLQVIPLGGLGEFGMNSMAIRYGDDIIVVDAGMMFPDAELLGVDIVTPDFASLGCCTGHGGDTSVTRTSCEVLIVVRMQSECYTRVVRG